MKRRPGLYRLSISVRRPMARGARPEPNRESHRHRLAPHGDLLRLCAGHWRCAEALCEDQFGFLSCRPFASSVDLRPGISFGEPWGAGSDRHGRFRRQVRDRHSHFYWIGAIPAMVFVGVFMMPFYYGSRARSVPEYLRLRFDEKTRAVNAVSFA